MFIEKHPKYSPSECVCILNGEYKDKEADDIADYADKHPMLSRRSAREVAGWCCGRAQAIYNEFLREDKAEDIVCFFSAKCVKGGVSDYSPTIFYSKKLRKAVITHI